MTSDLKVRTRYDQFILRRFAWVTHRPGVHEAELMGSATLRAQLGDRVVETISDVDGIFSAQLHETEHEYDRFIVDGSSQIFERYTPIPGSEHERLERKIQSEVHLVPLTLVAVLKSGS